MTESLQRPKLKFGVPIFAGVVNTRVGNIKIGTSTAPHDTDNYFAHSWTGKIFAGTADGLIGRKIWSLARPKNQQVKLSVGIAEKAVGEISIKPEPKLKISQQADIHAAQVISTVGNVKVKTSTRPDEDGNYFSHKWHNQLYVGNTNLRLGEIRINYKPPPRRSQKAVMRVGAVQVFSGEITINCEATGNCYYNA